MRNLIVVFLVSGLLMAFFSCHKTSVAPDKTYISNVTKARNWTGHFSQALVSPVGTGSFGNQAYDRYVTDTTFNISKVGSQMIKIPFCDLPLTYRSIDTAARTVTYDTVTAGGTLQARLIYSYSADSMCFSYFAVVSSEYGFDDPYTVHYLLYTH